MKAFSDEGWKARRRSPEQETHTDTVGGWSDSTCRFDTLTVDSVITRIEGFAVGLYQNKSNNNWLKRTVHLFWASCWRKNTRDYWLLPLLNHKANSTDSQLQRIVADLLQTFSFIQWVITRHFMIVYTCLCSWWKLERKLWEETWSWKPWRIWNNKRPANTPFTFRSNYHIVTINGLK